MANAPGYPAAEGIPTEEHRTRRRAAHRRAADAHDRAARTHEEAAIFFDGLGRPDKAARERAAARRDRADAELQRRVAEAQ